MTRTGILAILCACIVFPILAGPQEDRDRAIANAVAVQTALVQGRDALQARNYRTAVTVLENQIAHIDGNREYLEALRTAYRGYIGELRQAKKEADAQIYVNRLAIIDPTVMAESKPAPAASPAISTQMAYPSRPAIAEQPALTPPLRTPVAVIEESKAAPAPQPEAPNRGMIVRGVAADPFSYDNSTLKQAKSLLQRAEDAFFGERYDEAGKLYEQANQVDRSVVVPSKEQWAYCKFKSVVEQLNRASNSLPTLADLERDVHQAMSMAPRMDNFGKDLLHKIQDRRNGAGADAAPAVDVRHQKGDTGWSLAETTNFRIYHKMTRDMADQTARVAERTRIDMLRKWFGETEADWNPKCDIVVHASGEEYSRTTGVNSSLPGHSTTHSDGGRVISRRIDVHSDNPNMLVAILPHETTHVVLAGKYGEQTVPRWADEGMAVLTEPREKIDRHLQMLPKHMQERQLFNVRELMQMNDYPQARSVGPFYAQSVSLVEYLVNQKGPREFTEFMRDGLRGGYEPALKRHYNIQSFGDLEQRWTQSTFPGQATPTGVAERSR